MKKMESIGAKINWFLTGSNTLHNILELFEKTNEKLPPKFKEKMEEVFLGLKEAKKEVVDEILYNIAVYSMPINETKKIDEFEKKLRQEDSEKAEAFVLYVAKTVQMFEQLITEMSKAKQGKGAPQIKNQYKKFEAGAEEAKKFLSALLRKTGSNEDETFRKRVDFLEGKNVFSLIPEKKKANPTVEKIRSFFKQKSKEVINDQKTNLTGLKASIAQKKARAKRRWERK